MAKKVKCIDCEKGMNWALPVRVSANNLDYAKWCLRLAKNTVVCDRTHKTKPKCHEQYCKHYREKTHWFDQSAEIEELEKMIEEFEEQVE